MKRFLLSIVGIVFGITIGLIASSLLGIAISAIYGEQIDFGGTNYANLGLLGGMKIVITGEFVEYSFYNAVIWGVGGVKYGGIIGGIIGGIKFGENKNIGSVIGIIAVGMLLGFIGGRLGGGFTGGFGGKALLQAEDIAKAYTGARIGASILAAIGSIVTYNIDEDGTSVIAIIVSVGFILLDSLSGKIL